MNKGSWIDSLNREMYDAGLFSPEDMLAQRRYEEESTARTNEDAGGES